MDNSAYCPCCGEIRYYENVQYCESCGHTICRKCLVNDDLDEEWICEYCVRYDGTDEMREEYGFKEGDCEIGETIRDTGVLERYCPYCNNLKIDNDTLLKFAMNELLGVSKEELEKLYFEWRKNK